MQTKHTAGPWHTDDPDPADSYRYIFGPNGVNIARVELHRHGEANARLIAAAPETAAECERLRAVNADLVRALADLVEADTADKDTGTHGYQSGSPRARKWDFARAALAAAAKVQS